MASNESEKLKIEQLGTLHSVLAPVAYAYKHFGNQLQIENHILLEIEHTNCDFSEKLYKVLEYRLKQLPLLTWHDIVRALRSPAVHEQVLASEIESQYIPCSSSQSQLTSDKFSAPIGPDSGTNSPAQTMQHQYFPYQPQCYFPNPIPPPHQWLPQHQMHPPPPQQQVHLPYLHPQMYPPPTHHLPITYPQMHPSHPQPSHPQHPPSLHPETYPSPPQPQMYQYPYSGSSQSFMKPKLSVNPPVILSQPLTGRAQKRSSFEQVNVSSQAGSVSAKPRSFGLDSWQSQPLMAAPLSAKRHCVQPDPSPLPYSDSGSKALFNQFIQYLKTLYRRSPVEKRTEVLKLQTPGKMFINLACIDRKTKGLRTEYDEITEAMVRDGNVDVIEGRKCPIDMNAIAANLPEEALEKVILVEGAPGVGKSTFAWEFCRRWERGEIAQQYNLVLLLRLRDKNISQAKYLKDLIYHYSENVCEAVISELESCLGVNALLILEGYDELPDDYCHQPSLFLELINGQVLPLATVLITSRPWATCDVRRKFGHRIFQHIEVLGFTKEQITAYIRSTLLEEEALDLEERLRKQSTVRMCMYIPLNCAIVVTVYQEYKNNGVALPTTLSEYYVALSCAILLRYLSANNISSEPFKTLDNLPAAVKSKFCSLCQLAYDGIAGAGDQVKLIFTDLPEDFDGLGFMDSVFEFFVTQKSITSHNFLHLTLQEFLAAVHISTMDTNQRLEHFKRHADGRLRVVLKFLAGITELNDIRSASMFLDLMDVIPDQTPTAVDYSISSQVSWVYEAGRGMLIRDSFDEDKTVEFTCEDNFDSSALDYCIAHSCCKWILTIKRMIRKYEVKMLVNEIENSYNSGGVVVGLRGAIEKYSGVFEGLSISLDGLNILFKELPMDLNELALVLPAQCSAISWPDLSSLKYLTLQIDESIPSELDSLLPHLSLRSLTFGSNASEPLSLEDCEAIASHVATTTSLEELHFEFFGVFFDMSEKGMEKIFSAMLDNISLSLHTFSVRGVETIHDEAAEMLSIFILRNSLVSLDLPVGGLTAYGALQVAKALSEVHIPVVNEFFSCTVEVDEVTDFVELVSHYSQFLNMKRISSDVYFFGIGDDGVEELVEFLCDDSVMNNLNLSESDISHVGAELLGDLLHDNSTVELLDLSKNDIGDTGAEALAQALHSNTKLKDLNLSKTNIGDDGVKALAQALCSNTKLEKLNLSETNIGDDGVKALAQALHSNTKLLWLELSKTNIGDDGVKALAQALHSNTKLVWLELSKTNIGDDGVKALAQSLCHNSSLKSLHLGKIRGISEQAIHCLIYALTVNTSITRTGSSNGLLLDRVKCQNYAHKCPEYSRVQHKILFI